MPRAVAGRDEKQAMKATAKACIREALRNQEVLTSAPWEEFTKEKELVLIDGMAKYKLAFNRATQSESIPLDEKTRPLYINRGLFLCGFFGQSNFDLQSSGGPLAYMA